MEFYSQAMGMLDIMGTIMWMATKIQTKYGLCQVLLMIIEMEQEQNEFPLKMTNRYIVTYETIRSQIKLQIENHKIVDNCLTT